jgi:hypothetical protein
MSIKTRYGARQAGEDITDSLAQAARVSPSCKIYMPCDEGAGDPANLQSNGVQFTNDATTNWDAVGEDFQADATDTGTLDSIGTNAFAFGIATDVDPLLDSSLWVLGATTYGAAADHFGFIRTGGLMTAFFGNGSQTCEASLTGLSAGDTYELLMVVGESDGISRDWYVYGPTGLVESGNTLDANSAGAAIQDLTIADTVKLGFNASFPNHLRQLVYYVFDGGLPTDWQDWADEMMANLVANTKKLPARWTSV